MVQSEQRGLIKLDFSNLQVLVGVYTRCFEMLHWWRSEGVLISWRLPGGLSHRICTLHHVAAAALHPLHIWPPLHSAERYLPHLGSVATFSCLNVCKLNFVRLRTTGSARIRASPQVHPGLCPALPPLNTFVSPSAP